MCVSGATRRGVGLVAVPKTSVRLGQAIASPHMALLVGYEFVNLLPPCPLLVTRLLCLMLFCC